MALRPQGRIPPPRVAVRARGGCTTRDGRAAGGGSNWGGGLAVVGHRKTLLADVPIELLRFRFKSTQLFQQALEVFCVWVVNGEQLDIAELVMSG